YLLHKSPEPLFSFSDGLSLCPAHPQKAKGGFSAYPHCRIGRAQIRKPLEEVFYPVLPVGNQRRVQPFSFQKLLHGQSLKLAAIIVILIIKSCYSYSHTVSPMAAARKIYRAWCRLYY